MRRCNVFGSRINAILALTLLLSLTLFASFGCWGDPTFEIIFENQFANNVTVYVNDYKVGSVSPGEQLIDRGVPWNTGKYRIEAKTPQGEIVFSKTLTRDEMQEMKSLVYKVIIKPP